MTRRENCVWVVVQVGTRPRVGGSSLRTANKKLPEARSKMPTSLMTHKLRTAIGPLILLMITCSITVAAQAQAVADDSSTSWPGKIEAGQPSIVSENCPPPKNSPDNSPQVEVEPCFKNSAEKSLDSAGPAPQSTTGDKWQFQFTPYFWMAGLHGTTGIPDRTVLVNESFSDVFHSLSFALMGVFEARKDKWVVLTDVEYVSLEDDRATPGPLFSGVNAKIKLFIFNPEVGYRVFEDQDRGIFMDISGGVRTWRISTDFSFSPGILPGTQVEASRTWVDGLAGLRGGVSLSEKVFVNGKFDLGGGGSNFTYQFFGGGGYNVTPKIALIFGYRVLDVNYDNDNFVYDMNQRGPIIGVGFKF